MLCIVCKKLLPDHATRILNVAGECACSDACMDVYVNEINRKMSSLLEEEPLRIIFLDIDGVLNYCKVSTDNEIRYNNYIMCKIAVDLLNQYCEFSKAKLVISSTWRNYIGDFSTIQELIKSFGITAEVLGKTPTMPNSLRGNEIRKWLEDNTDITGCHAYEYHDYVILDDDSDMLLWQKDNYIQVDPLVGITPNTLNKMNKIFNIHYNEPNELDFKDFAYRMGEFKNEC